MSIIRKKSSNRIVRRGCKCQVRRLLLETLERRECPAVMFGFESGILSITGDEGPNVIEVIQRRDRMVEVVGDGERRTFTGVDKVFVDTLGGDDEVAAQLHWVFGTELPSVNLVVYAGAGDDKIKISDGEPTGTQRTEQTRQITIIQDMGPGSDLSITALNNHSNVSLDVISADGGDTIYVGTANGALRNVSSNHQNPTFDANLNLAGDENVVGFRTQGYNEVEVDLNLTGNGNTVEIALLLPAVQKVRESAARINVNADGYGNLVNASTVGFDDVTFSITAPSREPDVAAFALDASFKNPEGDHQTGNLPNHPVWKILIDPRNDNLVDIAASNFALASVNVATGDSEDDIRIQGTNLGNFFVDVNTAGGTDSISIDIDASSVEARVDAGGGNDTVVVDAQSNIPKRWFNVGPAPTLNPSSFAFNAMLGTGNDLLEVDAAGYALVNSFIDAGAGDDVIRHKFFAIVDRTQLHVGRTQLNFVALLGAGSDFLDLETFGFRDFQTKIFRGPAGDGRDTVVTRHVAPSRGRVSRIRLTLDGGRDTGDFSAKGYDTHSVQQIGDTGTHEVGHWFG